mgnify:FL=1
MPQLLIIADGKPGRAYELGDIVSIGRNSTQTIQLLDRLCSKEHALIRRQGGSYTIRDLGSRNGTFVNSRGVTSDIPLVEGDEITIGSTTLIFRGGSQEAVLPLKAGLSSNRVNIAPDILRSAISASLSYSGEQDFRPAALITDPSELKRD